MPTIVKTTNQEIPIPDDWVALAEETQEAKKQRDDFIRRRLSTYIPAIMNGTISYSEEKGKTIVRVTPQLGTKAAALESDQDATQSFFPTSRIRCSPGEMHRQLRDAPSYLPKGLLLAWELKHLQVTGQLTYDLLRSYHPKVREALQSYHHASLVEHIHQKLRDLPPVPAPTAPLGF